MLVSSKKQKGKKLEKWVANRLRDIFPFAYSRADSGSGKMYKEDVSLPANVPLFIECKNHATLDLNRWWSQTLYGCPKSKYPVLVYRLPYQSIPNVYMKLDDLLALMSGQNLDAFGINITITWNDFEKVLNMKYGKEPETTI